MLEARRWVSWACCSLLALGLTATAARAAEPPLLLLDAPLDVAEVKVATAEFTASGRTTPKAAVTLNLRGVNSQMVVAGPDGRFTFAPVMLLNGPNQVIIIARAGEYTTSLTRTITAERGQPKLVLDAPFNQPGMVRTGDARPYVSGTTEPGLTVRCRQGTAEVGVVALRDGRFMLQIPAALSEGDNELLLTAGDGAGRQARMVLTVHYGAAPPTVELAAPAEGARVADPVVNVVGRTKTGARIRVVVNGSVVLDTLAEGDGSFVFAGVPVAEGLNTVIVRATDPAGQSGEAQRQVVREPGAALLRLDAPLDRVQVRTTALRVNVSGTTWPNRAVTLQLGVRAPLSQMSDAQGRFAFKDVELVEGENVLRIAAADASGGQAVIERCVEVDRKPPIINFTLPGPLPYVETAKLTLRGRTAADAAVAMKGPSGEVSGRADGFGNFSLNDIPIVDGPNRYSLSATDDLGNQAVLPLVIYGRVSDPRCEVKTPTEGWQSSRHVVFNFEYEEGCKVDVVFDGKDVTDWQATAPGGEPVPYVQGTLDLGNLKPGDHEITVAVTSPTGKRRSAVVRKFYVPGLARALNVRLQPPVVSTSGLVQLSVDVRDERNQPVEDGTVVLVELPAGWTADGKPAGPDNQVRLLTRHGQAAVQLTSGGAAQSGVILVSAGRFSDGPSVALRTRP